MSQVTSSASANIAALFNAVGTVAKSANTTFQALNSAADTLATHTQAWAHRSKIGVTLETINYEQTARARAAVEGAKQLAELQKEIAENSALAPHIAHLEALYAAKLDSAKK